MLPTKYQLKLVSLSCYLTDEKDADEVFLVLHKKQVWPVGKKFLSLKNGKIPINIDVSDFDKDSSVSFELWDYDRFSNNNNIGSFMMLINEKGGPHFTDLLMTNEGTKAKYTLEWEVV